MNYTLRQLEVFTQICASKNITKAAEAMHMSQPAASIQLKNFQAQFDVPLTEVIGRQLYITRFGEEIRDACLNILEETKKIEASAMAYHGHLTGKIRMSIVSTGKYIMPHFLTDFMHANPSVELVMDVTNKTSVLESLDANDVDFSLVSILPEMLSIDKVELMKNSLYLVGGRHSENVKKAWSPGKLSALPMIYRELGSGTRQTMERFLERHGVQPIKRLELTSNEAVKQAVVAGLGYSIMPLIGIRNELERGDLKIIPVKGLPEETSWNLIWLKSKKFLPASKAFLAYIEDEKERIIKHRFEWYK